MTHDMEKAARMLEDAAKDLDAASEDLEEVTESLKHKHHKEGSAMDIASLLALVQSNKGANIGELMALCKGRESEFGGQGFLFIILLLLLMNRDGGLLGANRAAAVEAVGAANCNQITDLYDRIYSAQAASSEGFAKLDTSICTSIATVISAVRDQGDRTFGAITSLSQQVSECCCAIQQKLDAILCGIRELSGKVELMQERNVNAMNQMENRLSSQNRDTQQMIKDTQCQMNLGFERLGNKMDTMNLQNENERLKRALEASRERELAQSTSSAAVRELKDFIAVHCLSGKSNGNKS